jgi:hypothetical protein
MCDPDSYLENYVGLDIRLGKDLFDPGRLFMWISVFLTGSSVCWALCWCRRCLQGRVDQANAGAESIMVTPMLRLSHIISFIR